MEVISICVLQAAGFEWQPRGGTHALTVVCKATYDLSSDPPTLAAEQDLLNDVDEHWNDDPSRSVRSPSDRAPYKPRVDVVLVGSAFAPRQQPVRSFTVRLAVAELDKVIEVWCDRAVRAHDGQLLEGQRITKMPLRWEKAAGGPDSQNPTGMRFDAAPDRYGMIAVANLQPPGTHVASKEDAFAPIGYGPVGPQWPGRLQRLQGRAARFFERDWASRPLPVDFDYSYFNMAPPDQQIAELRPGERILLENLHPEHPRLVTTLPRTWPRVVAARATGEREEVVVAADTLWIDTDRGVCTVVWRGRIGLRHQLPSPIEEVATGDPGFTTAGRERGFFRFPDRLGTVPHDGSRRNGARRGPLDRDHAAPLPEGGRAVERSSAFGLRPAGAGDRKSGPCCPCSPTPRQMSCSSGSSAQRRASRC